MTYDSSLALMDSGLNGIVGSNYGGYNSYGSFGNYGYGFTPSIFTGYGNITNVEGAKDNIRNQYDVYSTQQSYGNRQNVENMNYAQKSQMIGELLREGRGQDAIGQFNALCAELKASGTYGEYSDSQIKTIAASIYQQSTGENLIEAIKATTPGSLTKGLMEGVPIIGTFFTDNTSKEDLISEVTDMPKRPQDQVAKTLGATASGAASGAAIGAALGLCGGPLTPLTSTAGAIGGAIIGGVIGFFKSLF